MAVAVRSVCGGLLSAVDVFMRFGVPIFVTILIIIAIVRIGKMVDSVCCRMK
jgi:hypothetical protein